jgi:hypothetical protein
MRGLTLVVEKFIDSVGFITKSAPVTSSEYGDRSISLFAENSGPLT